MVCRTSSSSTARRTDARSVRTRRKGATILVGVDPRRRRGRELRRTRPRGLDVGVDQRHRRRGRELRCARRGDLDRGVDVGDGDREHGLGRRGGDGVRDLQLARPDLTAFGPGGGSEPVGVDGSHVLELLRIVIRGPEVGPPGVVRRLPEGLGGGAPLLAAPADGERAPVPIGRQQVFVRMAGVWVRLS